MPILDCPTDIVSPPPTPTCVPGVVDIEFACSSIDGRMLFVQLYRLADCTVTKEIVELDGSPLADASTLVSCGRDYELVTSCYQDISNPSVKYDRAVIIDVDTLLSVGVIWLDSAGAIIPAPVNAEICSSPITQLKSTIQRLSGPYSVLAPFKSTTVTALTDDVTIDLVLIPKNFTWSVGSDNGEQFINQVEIDGTDYIVTETR